MGNRKSKYGKIVGRIGDLRIVKNEDSEEGLAYYGLYGLVDEQDNVIIPCDFLNLQKVDHNLIRVENQDGIYAFLDHQGKEVVPFSRGYNFAGSFADGRAIVGKYTENRDDYIDVLFEDYTFDYYNLLTDPVNGTWRSPIYSINELPKQFGFIDQFGNEVIPLQYQDVKNFHEGLAAVKDTSGKWGFIDVAGEVVIPFEYDGVISTNDCKFKGFPKGTIIVKKNGKWLTITKENNPVAPLDYAEVLSRYIETARVIKMKRNRLI
ncbi:WG repeat-containing protein [Paenibacillus sp. FSL R5-0527]|uniref:WG repeat-containing protein n=1 Tax=Paenibacillus sp. FSL R5-0527 TaxID=2975321 RepID=UPI00097B94EC|nr:hypothetical protein BK140_10310 [Paenibacillus macerans]